MIKMDQEVTESALKQSATKQISNIQPIWHFLVISIVTFGLYDIYWFYRNWKQLKAHKYLDINPIKRTIGLIIPIYSLVVTYEYFSQIRDVSRDAGVEKLYSLGLVFFSCWFFSVITLSDKYGIIGILILVPLSMVQNTLNSYWEIEQPGYLKKTNFHLLGEILVALVFTVLCFSLIEIIRVYLF